MKINKQILPIVPALVLIPCLLLLSSCNISDVAVEQDNAPKSKYSDIKLDKIYYNLRTENIFQLTSDDTIYGDGMLVLNALTGVVEIRTLQHGGGIDYDLLILDNSLPCTLEMYVSTFFNMDTPVIQVGKDFLTYEEFKEILPEFPLATGDVSYEY